MTDPSCCRAGPGPYTAPATHNPTPNLRKRTLSAPKGLLPCVFHPLPLPLKDFTTFPLAPGPPGSLDRIC